MDLDGWLACSICWERLRGLVWSIGLLPAWCGVRGSNYSKKTWPIYSLAFLQSNRHSSGLLCATHPCLNAQLSSTHWTAECTCAATFRNNTKKWNLLVFEKCTLQGEFSPRPTSNSATCVTAKTLEYTKATNYNHYTMQYSKNPRNHQATQLEHLEKLEANAFSNHPEHHFNRLAILYHPLKSCSPQSLQQLLATTLNTLTTLT